MVMSVRLYGRAVGNGSLSVVTAGFRDTLEAAGLLDGFVALDKSGGSEEDESPGGALARDAVFTGNLSHLGVMRVGTRHERHWVTVTPNSNYLPKDLLAAVVSLKEPHILSASSWGTQVILDALAEMGASVLRHHDGGRALFADNKEVRIHTVHHGVSGFAPDLTELSKTRDDFYHGHFRVVHFSTTEGQRKGTLELLKAWSMFLRTVDMGRCYPTLHLVLDHHARTALKERMLDELDPESLDAVLASVRWLPRADMDAAQMSSFLCQHHLLCAPSRGEGFGLLPLQARACGVPVVATVSTGHSAGHVEGLGVIPIMQPGAPEPLDDGPGAMALAALPEEIVLCLRKAMGNWPTLKRDALAEAPLVGAEWSWSEQLAPLVEWLL
jgi:Glycosyl transferases group 1